MSELPRLYAEHLARDRRRSVHTVRAYEATAVRLCAFLSQHWGETVDRASLAKVDTTDLRAFLGAAARRRARQCVRRARDVGGTWLPRVRGGNGGDGRA